MGELKLIGFGNIEHPDNNIELFCKRIDADKYVKLNIFRQSYVRGEDSLEETTLSFKYDVIDVNTINVNMELVVLSDAFLLDDIRHEEGLKIGDALEVNMFHFMLGSKIEINMRHVLSIRGLIGLFENPNVKNHAMDHLILLIKQRDCLDVDKSLANIAFYLKTFKPKLYDKLSPSDLILISI